MTPYERYIFDGRCPYTNIPCYKECACVNCEVNTHEIEDAEELDRAESEDKERMSEQMEFPESFEKFAKEYGFKDDKEVYTNGSDLISIFRVKQWLEHDNKLRTIEIDTAYECGKHANKWIPFKTRPMTKEEKEEYPEWDGILDCKLPDDGQRILVNVSVRGHESVQYDEFYTDDGGYLDSGYEIGTEATAWMPLPEPYKAESEDKE